MRSLRAFALASVFLGLVGCSAAPYDDASGESAGAISSEDRASSMDALRAALAPEMGGQQIVFDARQGHYASEGDWAFVIARIQLKDGGEPTTRGTPFDALAKEGIFDGFRVEALMHKEAGVWKVTDHAVGATDLWWDGLWQAHSAPKSIFPDFSAPAVTASERQSIMTGLRAVVKPELGNQDILFNVKGGHFEANKGWAFLRGSIQLRDGKEPTTKGTKYEALAKEGLFDGFQFQALLKLEGGSWKVLEHGVGSTDVWWAGLAAKYPDAPSTIWDEMAYQPE